MHVETWIPKTNDRLDTLFEDLRKQQNSDTSHRLYANYNSDNFVENMVALSILFDDHGFPASVGSILKRDICWPSKVCRILNRFWKVSDRRLKHLTGVTPVVAEMIRAQQTYVKENTDFELVFMSRQHDHWQKFAVDSLQKDYGLEFKYDNYKYLTWTEEQLSSSWQHIIYSGNENLLNEWRRR